MSGSMLSNKCIISEPTVNVNVISKSFGRFERNAEKL